MKSVGLALAVAIAIGSFSTMTIAQTLDTNQRNAINELKTASGDQELKCTGKAGSLKCISDVAWVCPDNWKACTAPKGGTCCQQR